MIAHALLAAAILLHHDGGVIRSGPNVENMGPKDSAPAASDERSVPVPGTSCTLTPQSFDCDGHHWPMNPATGCYQVDQMQLCIDPKLVPGAKP